MPNYYEEIAKNIFYRVKDGISLDIEYIQEVLELVIKEENINSALLKNMYTFDSDILLEKKAFEINNPFSPFLDKYEKEFFYYLSVTRILLKNIYFMIQKKHLKNELFEIKLLNLIANFKMNTASHFYRSKNKALQELIRERKYSSVSILEPFKRTAIIASFASIFEITAFLEQEKLNTINKILFCENLLHSYRYLQFLQNIKKEQEIELSPTCFYFEQMVGQWQTKSLKKQQYNFDAIKRLELGLFLSEQEIDKIKEMKKELKRNLIV